jgi:hypothetical protein
MSAAIEERLPETHMTVVGEVFQSEDEPAPPAASPLEEAAPAPDAAAEKPVALDFDPDDPNAPL